MKAIELACVASVSVGLESKVFGVLPARKMEREPQHLCWFSTNFSRGQNTESWFSAPRKRLNWKHDQWRRNTLTGENTKPSSISSSAGSMYWNSSPGNKNMVYYVRWRTGLSYLASIHNTVHLSIFFAFLSLYRSTMLTCWSLCFYWLTVFSLYYEDNQNSLSDNCNVVLKYKQGGCGDDGWATTLKLKAKVQKNVPFDKHETK